MKKIDIPLLIATVILTLFGLLMIYNASSYIAFRDFGDKYHYFSDQLIWIFLGMIGLLFFSFFDYHKLYYVALPSIAISLVLLVLVFIPGLGIKALGAHRWINLGFFVLQPAEFVKPAVALYLAAWFSQKERGRLLAFSSLMGVLLILIMLEPDMGTASIILAEALIVYFVSGGAIIHFLLGIPVVLIAGFLLITTSSYRAARLMSFLAVDKSVSDASYHVKQILIALGMGGIAGVGLGNSLQKYAYLPENTTDSIFAIIGEEVGFLGACIVVLLLAIVVVRGFSIAISAKESFGKLLATGLISFLGIQMIINLSAMTALLPLTGVPLPFISYGGSALIVDLCSIGILLNISKQGVHHK